MNNDNKDLIARTNTDAVQNSGGPNASSNDIRNFMPSFRSALSQLDRLNAVADNGIGDYPANPMESMPSSRTSGSYHGYRPAGLLGLALALTSRTPMSSRGPDDMVYEEETQFEAGNDYSRMSYSRRMKSQTGNGQPTLIRMGVHMLQEYHDRHCPYHGSERHKHAPADDDGYKGPIITELSDDEEEIDTGRGNIALPSSCVSRTGKCVTYKNAHSNKKVKVNKNAVCRRNETVMFKNATKLVDDNGNKSLNGTNSMNQVENTSEQKQKRETSQSESAVQVTTPKVNVLRRRNLDPYGHDNRKQYEHDDIFAQHCRVSIPAETSNIPISLFKPDTVPTVHASHTIGLPDTKKQVETQCLPQNKLDTNGEATSIKQSDERHVVHNEDVRTLLCADNENRKMTSANPDRYAPESIVKKKINLDDRSSIDYRENDTVHVDMEAESLLKESHKNKNMSQDSCSNAYIHGDGNTGTSQSSVLKTEKHIESPNKKINIDEAFTSDKGKSGIKSNKSNLESKDQKQSNIVKSVGKAQTDRYGDVRTPNKNMKMRKEYDKGEIRGTNKTEDKSLNATDIRTGQNVSVTNPRDVQPLDKNEIEGGQRRNVTEIRVCQMLDKTDIGGGQSMNATDIEGGKSMDATDRKGGQSLDATNIRRSQRSDATDKKGGKCLTTTDLKGGQRLNTTDIGGGQGLNTTDNQGGQVLVANDITLDKSVHTTTHIRGCQSLNDIDIGGSQSMKATDIGGGQSINATDIDGGQSLNTTNIAAGQSLNATDMREGQPVNTIDITVCQSLNTTNIRGGQSLNTTDIGGGQSLNITVNPDVRVLLDNDVKDKAQSNKKSDSGRNQYHTNDGMPPQQNKRVKKMPNDSSESSMSTSKLTSVTKVNQYINTFPKDGKDHNNDESANAPSALLSNGVLAKPQVSNETSQSTQERSINKFEIRSSRSSEPKMISFNQMIKSQLPPNVSSSECDDVLKANFQREDIQPNPISEIFQSQVELSNVSRKDVPHSGAPGTADDTFRNTGHLANGSRNNLHNKTQINTFDGNVRQNNLTHEMTNFGTEPNATDRQSTGGCDKLGRYAYQCEGCGMVHICCKDCDGMLVSLCGHCPKCDRTITSVLSEGDSSIRQGQPSRVHIIGHLPSCRQALGVNIKHHKQTQHEASSVTGRGKNVTGSHGTSSSNMAVSMLNSYFGDQLEEQHPLDDPEWKHVTQNAKSNVSDIQTQQKPPRNKNLIVRKSPSSQRNSANESQSTETRTQINSPNFTTTSYQHSYDRSKETSSNQSNHNDTNYQRSSSTDRLTSLSKIMLKQGMVVKDVYPDGNCFFAAVVDQLRVRGEFYYTAKSLRQAAVKYLRKHPKQEDGTPLLEFVADHDTITWKEYLSRLKRDGEWADHIIISAISNVLKRRLVIHSVRRIDQQIIKTIMEPNTRNTSRGPRQPKRNEVNAEPTKGNGCHIDDKTSSAEAELNDTDDESDVDAALDDTGDDDDDDEDELCGKEEIAEDIMLGHIPESHYVSLRYADWEDKLFTSLRARTNEPQTILTMYGQPRTQKTRDSSIDSNEDLDGHGSVPRFWQLPTDHFNFLFKYLRNGHFVECRSYRYEHPPFPKEVKSFYTSWCVGDTVNGLESSLVTDSIGTNTTRFNYDNAIAPSAWYIAFPHDIVVSKNTVNDEFKPKQLIPDDTNCKLGYLKLKPVTPRIWGDQLRKIDDINYLNHLHLKVNKKSNTPVPVHVALKCDWPEQAMVCKEQMKKFRIQFDAHKTTMQQKVIDGVRVIPVCSHSLTCIDPDCVEWKYSFAVIEYVISWNIITADARFCFKIMSHFLNYVFNNKEVITKEHIKAVFFHTCADLNIGHRESNFLEIVSHFMLLLETFLKDGNVPDFFMRPINLIENVAEADMVWHYERTRVVKEQYIVYMFLFLDQKGLMDEFSLSKCFDELLFDAQKLTRTTDRCFERLTVMEACEWVLDAKFNKAKALIAGHDTDRISDEEEEGDDIGHGESENKAELHKRVISHLPLQEQWLYAFFLEFETGLPLLAHVCDQHKCSKLKDLFGEIMIDIIILDEYSHIKNRDIELPNDIAQQEGIASFAVQFSSVLRSHIYCRLAYAAGIHTFLSMHSDKLLDSITSEDNNGYSKSITSLFQLHGDLYRYYQSNCKTDLYSNLMIPYSRLCDYQPTVTNYEWLADLWNYFGDNEQANAAQMKANAMLENKYAKETKM